MDQYDKGPIIGEGSHGRVYRATHRATERQVAIKKIRVGAAKDGVHVTALREIKMLKELQSPHVVELLDVFPNKSGLSLVFEYMDHSLDTVIRDRSIHLTQADIKAYLQMMLKGLAYIHSQQVVHRDLKPDNLLLDGATGCLKVADFGLARSCASPDGRFTNHVFGRWYRAPELLFGATTYGPDVDMWAAGCVFAEMMLRRPWFPGSCDMDQLDRIFAAFGVPTAEQWPGMKDLANYIELRPCKGQPLSTTFAQATADALDLLSCMMALDPAKRLTAAEALAHPYFTSHPIPTHPAVLPKPAARTGPPLQSLPSFSNMLLPPTAPQHCRHHSSQPPVPFAAQQHLHAAAQQPGAGHRHEPGHVLHSSYQQQQQQQQYVVQDAHNLSMRPPPSRPPQGNSSLPLRRRLSDCLSAAGAAAAAAATATAGGASSSGHAHSGGSHHMGAHVQSNGLGGPSAARAQGGAHGSAHATAHATANGSAGAHVPGSCHSDAAAPNTADPGSSCFEAAPCPNSEQHCPMSLNTASIRKRSRTLFESDSKSSMHMSVGPSTSRHVAQKAACEDRPGRTSDGELCGLLAGGGKGASPMLESGGAMIGGVAGSGGGMLGPGAPMSVDAASGMVQLDAVAEALACANQRRLNSADKRYLSGLARDMDEALLQASQHDPDDEPPCTAVSFEEPDNEHHSTMQGQHTGMCEGTPVAAAAAGSNAVVPGGVQEQGVEGGCSSPGLQGWPGWGVAPALQEAPMRSGV